MRHVLLMIYIACVIAAVPARAQEEARIPAVKVAVERMHENGQGFYQVRAEAFVPVAAQAVWKVLTDYDRFHQYVPGITTSKVVSRSENDIVIEQEGRAAFLFFSHHIHLVVRALEQPFSRIDIVLVSGDMKVYESHWELMAETQDGVGGTRINYSGRLEPDFFLPAMFGNGIIRSDGEKMLAAVIAEIGKTTAP